MDRLLIGSNHGDDDVQEDSTSAIENAEVDEKKKEEINNFIARIEK